jgi:hypothetical protein
MKHRKALKRRYGRARFDPTDFDLKQEMEDGGVVQDARGGGYAASFNGKYLGHFKSRGGALAAIVREMEKSNYYPNVFYVNDHGNATLLSVRANPKGKGVLTRYIYGWV